MERFNGAYWKEHVEEQILPAIERFGDITRSRIWPVFEGIDREATDLETRRREELMSEAEVPEGYFWEASEAMADLAYWEASGYHETLSAMMWATRGLFSAGLYHLTEQNLAHLPLAMLSFHRLGSEVRWKGGRQPDQAVEWFKDELGLEVKVLPSWSAIDDLRHIANVMKHGDGKSAEVLRQRDALLFVHPSLRQQANAIPMRTTTPLFGDGVYITLEAFNAYHERSRSFWAEFAEQLPGLTR